MQPELGDRIERALTLALSQDDDEAIKTKGGTSIYIYIYMYIYIYYTMLRTYGGLMKMPRSSCEDMVSSEWAALGALRQKVYMVVSIE